MAADVAVAYLQIALDAAKRGDWDTAAANAAEGGKYCGIAARLGRVGAEEDAKGGER
jgi:hypothetical protein